MEPDARRPDEVRALSRLAAAELEDGTGGIGSFHDAIAQRVFGALGPGAAPVRRTHDTIARGVYASLRGTTSLVGRAADEALRRRDPGDGRPISSTPRGALALAAAFPAATGRLVVFVHGLMETEHAWRLGGGEGYGARLARDLGRTPVDIRYNTGRHISHNGRSLAELLDAVVAAWPVPVDEIALVGHSMGGLVARSAGHRAAAEGHAWVAHVRHVVSLGSPHLGAPLAQGVHYAAHALHAVPETRPLGRFLRRRSAGIRDLRQGSLVDRDWEGCDPDALRAAACAEVPLLDGATHCFVSATITRDPGHPVGRLIGDALVLTSSATGRGRSRRVPFREEDGLHVGGAHHLALLDHPAVYAQLRAWLARSPARRAGKPAAEVAPG